MTIVIPHLHRTQGSGFQMKAFVSFVVKKVLEIRAYRLRQFF